MSLPVAVPVDGRDERSTSDAPGHPTHENTSPITGVVCDENQQTISVTPIHKLSPSALLRRIAHWDGSSLAEMSQVLNLALESQGYHDLSRISTDKVSIRNCTSTV